MFGVLSGDTERGVKVISKEKPESDGLNQQKGDDIKSAHPKKSAKLKYDKSGFLYQGIVKALPDLIIMSDIEGNLIYASDVAIKMFDIKDTEEVIGTSIFDWILPDEHERLSKNRLDIINGTPPKTSLYTAVRKDGSTFPMEVHNARLNDKDGNPIGTVAILRDITEKNEKEVKLNNQDMLLNALFESTSETRILLDVSGRIIRSNEEGARRLGVSIEDMSGREIFEFLPEKVRESEKRNYLKFIKNPEPYHSRDKRDGRWYDIHVYPILDISDSLAQISVMATDITDKISVMEKLVQSEERYRSLFDNSHTIMLLIDPVTLNIVDANRSAEKFYGYTHQEITSMKITDINQNPTEATAVNAKNAFNGKVNNFIFPHRLANGDIRDVEVFSNPVMIGHKSLLFSVIHDITEKKILEQQVHDALYLNSRIIDESPVGIVVYKLTGECVMANDTAARIAGGPLEEILRTNFKSLVSWRESGMLEAADEAIRENRIVSRLINLTSTFGKEITVDCKFGFLEIKGEKHHLLMFEDVTPRIKAEEMLRISEGRFRKFMDTLNEMVWLNSVDGKESIYVNPAFEKIYGRNVENYRSNPDIWLEAVHPQDKEIAMASAIELAERGFSKSEYRIIKPKGEVVWLQDVKFKVLDAKGRPVQTGGMRRDITQQKNLDMMQRGLKDNLEKEVAERTRQLKEINQSLNRATDEWQKTFDSVQDIIWLVDDEMSILRFNQASKEKFGGDIEGKHCWEVVHGTKGPLPQCPVLQMQESKKRESVELELNGSWKLITVDPVLDKNRNIISAVHIISDITDRKKAEAERIAIVQQLQQAQRIDSIALLAGSIAHDFNNLLMAILGNIELTLFDENTSAASREYLHSAAKAVHKASDLTSQMLAYAGKGRNHIEDTSLNEIIKVVMPVLDSSVSNRISIITDLNPALPIISVDIGQMKQIIINLVINASEAIGDNPGVITISTGTVDCKKKDLETPWPDDALPEGRYVFFKVSDTGCGMDKQTKQRIFDPFFTTKFFGRGLGMAAVQGIVKNMRGTIRIESEPCKGSSFCVILPAQSSPAENSSVSQHETGNRHKKTILLVDDEQIVLNAGRKMLEVLGFNVITAANGAEAVETFKKNRGPSNETSDRIICIVLDLVMPVMGGEEALVKFRQIDPDIPVVVISGYPEDIIKKKIEFKDIQQVVMKPFEMGLLCKKIIEALGEGQSANTP
jgi:PAS domain S-box-containing protein